MEKARAVFQYKTFRCSSLLISFMDETGAITKNIHFVVKLKRDKTLTSRSFVDIVNLRILC